MSEFGSIKNAGKPESATNLKNGSFAQFGVASPDETVTGMDKFDSSKDFAAIAPHSKEATGAGGGLNPAEIGAGPQPTGQPGHHMPVNPTNGKKAV